MKEKKYVWQNKKWPNFFWDDSEILPVLSLARRKQGLILAHAAELGLEAQAKILTEDAQTTSEIEGEKLEVTSLRSSVAKRLGLSSVGVESDQRNIEGVIDMLLDATQNFKKPLTDKRLKGWQAGLFPTGYSGISKIDVGTWRTSSEPMRVISGNMGKEKIHFEAPPATILKQEMNQFINWFNRPKPIDGLLRAGVAHFWFVTIHPFDDGNGRIARAISDLALAQDEEQEIRCYSFSSQIKNDRNQYYKILEDSQKGNLDLTDWLVWFLNTYMKAVDNSLILIQKSHSVKSFWTNHALIDINERQKKVLQKMLEAEPAGFIGGITNKKYVSITKVSPATAKRDLAYLQEKGLIKMNESKGRSASYSLRLKKLEKKRV